MQPISARTLEATSNDGLIARLRSYVDDESANRLADAATVRVLALDDCAVSAADVIAALARVGAAAERSGRGVLVAATHSMLVACERTATGAVADAVRALREAHERAAGPAPTVRLRDRTLDLRDEALVMGVLNVTPDSFYDNGRFAGVDRARARAEEMVGQGAALIDIGGQSYAHWNPRIAADEEVRRVVPVVEALIADGLDVALSIDTFKATVAEAALAAGAHLINDCSGLSDPALAATVARYDAALVVMHLKGELNVRSRGDYVYVDALAEIVRFLEERLRAARTDGVAADSLIIDPGLEFGKEPATDLEILDRFGELRALGVPILFASSRKSFIGRIFNRPARELLVPSLATAALGIAAGARMLRVHDVAETVQLARMYAAVEPRRRATLAVAAEMPEAGNPKAAPAV